MVAKWVEIYGKEEFIDNSYLSVVAKWVDVQGKEAEGWLGIETENNNHKNNSGDPNGAVVTSETYMTKSAKKHAAPSPERSVDAASLTNGIQKMMHMLQEATSSKHWFGHKSIFHINRLFYINF